MKLNDKVKMLEDTHWWTKGDIGRIVEIDQKDDYTYYLLCFDAACHKMHKINGGHTWYASDDEIEQYNPLMNIE